MTDCNRTTEGLTLKPCPICGGKAEIMRKGTVRNSMLIGCENCGCKVESGDVYGLTTSERLRWNQRHGSPAGAGTNHQDPGTPGDERRLAVGAARVEGVGATASLPEPPGADSSYRRMFEAACSSLGEIAKEAGVPEEHADDGPEAILDAIRALKQRVSPEPSVKPMPYTSHREALQDIADAYAARSELFTNDADCAANLADRARAGLRLSAEPGGGQAFTFPFTHWSKDPLIPYQGCNCSSCAEVRGLSSQTTISTSSGTKDDKP